MRSPNGQLRAELKALVEELGAADAAIIDSASPVVWCAAHSVALGEAPSGGAAQQLVMTPQLQEAIRLLQLSRLELIEQIRAEWERSPGQLAEDAEAEADENEPKAADVDAWGPEQRRYWLGEAIRRVRETTELRDVPKGAKFSHVDERDGRFVALSFGGIYVLVVVGAKGVELERTREAFEKRRARIEALVSALPAPRGPA